MKLSLILLTLLLFSSCGVLQYMQCSESKMSKEEYKQCVANWSNQGALHTNQASMQSAQAAGQAATDAANAGTNHLMHHTPPPPPPPMMGF